MDGGFGRDDTDRHFWLTRSVARVAGVSLGRAMTSGSLSVDGYGEMVARCQGGGCATMCELWLAAQRDWPAAPPPFCAHVAILAELRQKQRPH